LTALTVQRRPEELADRVLDEGVGMTRPSESLGGCVSQHLAPVCVGDYNAVLERCDGLRQQFAISFCAGCFGYGALPLGVLGDARRYAPQLAA
jgi:hypothetical protein